MKGRLIYRFCPKRFGGRVLLLDVSVQMEVTHFPQPRIELSENIIAPEKCVIVNRLLIIHRSPLARIIFEACFGLCPFAYDMAIQTTTRGSFWSLTFLKEGDRGPRDVFPDKTDK